MKPSDLPEQGFASGATDVSAELSFVVPRDQIEPLYDAFFAAGSSQEPLTHIFRLSYEELIPWRLRPLSRLLHLLFWWAGFPQPTREIYVTAPPMTIQSVTFGEGAVEVRAVTPNRPKVPEIR